MVDHSIFVLYQMDQKLHQYQASLQLAWDLHRGLDVLLDVLYRVASLHVKGDGLACWHLDEELPLC